MTDRSGPHPVDHYPVLLPVQMRYNDLDPYCHANNAVYYAWFDTALTDWMIAEGLAERDMSGPAYVMLSTSCRYFTEVTYDPDGLRVGLGIDRLGDSSVTYRLGIFAQNTELASAEGHITQVHIDHQTRRPHPIPADHRDKFERLSAAA